MSSTLWQGAKHNSEKYQPRSAWAVHEGYLSRNFLLQVNFLYVCASMYLIIKLLLWIHNYGYIVSCRWINPFRHNTDF